MQHRLRLQSHPRYLLAAVVLWLLAPHAPGTAQDKMTEEPGVQPAPQADPADFGLRLPDAPARQAAESLVVVNNSASELVVAKPLIEVGDYSVVMVPDGRLQSLPTREATATDRKFEPVKMGRLAKSFTEGSFKGFKTRTTRRYLYVYNTSEAFQQTTGRILETMYPALAAYWKRLKVPVHEPDVPLVVIMFRTQEEFEKFHEMPEGVAAYYNGVTNHVVMYEQSKLVEVAPELAVKQSISTIAHEGVHQVLHNIGVQRRLSHWPMWIGEGLPEYFAPTTVGERVRWKGVGKVNDLRMKSLEDDLKRLPPDGLIRPTVEAQTLTAHGYASAWALTHFLAERRKTKFAAYLTEVSQRGPLQTFTVAQNVELFTRHFGDDFDALDAELIAHLKKLPYEDPITNQTHYVVMMQVAEGVTVRRAYVVTASPKAASDWRVEQTGQHPAAAFDIRAFPNAALATAFGKGWLGK
jgi:hypothetical protein